jgi:ABC-type xylose transport system substrate-binding protein
VVQSPLSAQGLAGTVPVSGQDGDHAALNRVALGTQTVSVWKDSRELGKKCRRNRGNARRGKTMDEIEGTVTTFNGGPKGVEMKSVFLAPLPITKDNLNVVIDAGWIPRKRLARASLPARSRPATEQPSSGTDLTTARRRNVKRCGACARWAAGGG